MRRHLALVVLWLACSPGEAAVPAVPVPAPAAVAVEPVAPACGQTEDGQVKSCMAVSQQTRVCLAG